LQHVSQFVSDLGRRCPIDLRVRQQRGRTIAPGYLYFRLLQILARYLAVEDAVNDFGTGFSVLLLHIRLLTINTAWLINARSSQGFAQNAKLERSDERQLSAV
jgi:hypothetical protein